MALVTLDVNGRKVSSDVPARMHLGDFLREEARLTGTHLGCEHGVCGACTVLMDGQPIRSCISFASACAGKHITTIEGYDADPVMRRLREAFTAHHALQCGYCTPGMLATARDIVLRCPDADEARVRVELAGNLCRCTGYMGIVAAIRSVLADLIATPDAEISALRRALRGEPAGAVAALPAPVSAADSGAVAASASKTPFEGFIAKVTTPINDTAAVAPVTGGTASASTPSSPGSNSSSPASAASSSGSTSAAAATPAPRAKGSEITGQFEVPFPADQVWAFMVDLPAVASCLPGASITEHDGDRVKGKVAIKFGPMSAAFNGAARLERDDAAQTAVFRGAGQDTLSQSRANGDITYRLTALDSSRTRVDVELLYSLQGPLAQFSRSGLVQDFVRRMIADFGRNVTARLQRPADAGMPPPVAAFSPTRMFFGVLWDRIKGIFTRPH
jgi:carbon-monoxide dehydrogenase small subunit